MKRWSLIGIILICTITSCAVISYAQRESKKITLSQYGLNGSSTGEQVYWVLYNAHKTAFDHGKTVDYTGIDTLRIEIPKNAKSIPLTSSNDFNGVVFLVTNKSKDLFLFEYENESKPITISKADIDKGEFIKYKKLKEGKHLLCIKDQNPWVENRKGYKYGHIREDILLVINGKAKNTTVMPYNNDYSATECKYYEIDGKGFHFDNIVFNRTQECKYKTFLCHIKGVEGLEMNSVTATTPDNEWTYDRIIDLEDCANVKFDNVRIDGTYSRNDFSGYGVQMNNIWNFWADHMYGHANWGIFGTNNVNTARITNSDINRFDIHCYGRDVHFEHVIFRNKYNSFSSVFGTISFDDCTFINFVPIINDVSYNSYVGYDLVFNNCEYSTEHDTPVLLLDGYIDDDSNTRPEISKRCAPNVSINNLTMNIPKKAPNAYLFFFKEKGKHCNHAIDYMSNITINGLKFVYKGDEDRTPANFIISNVKINTTNEVRQDYNNIDTKSNSKRKASNRGKIIENISKGEPGNGRTSLNMEIIVPTVLILGASVYGVKRWMA